MVSTDMTSGKTNLSMVVFDASGSMLLLKSMCELTKYDFLTLNLQCKAKQILLGTTQVCKCGFGIDYSWVAYVVLLG